MSPPTSLWTQVSSHRIPSHPLPSPPLILSLFERSVKIRRSLLHSAATSPCDLLAPRSRRGALPTLSASAKGDSGVMLLTLSSPRSHIWQRWQEGSSAHHHAVHDQVRACEDHRGQSAANQHECAGHGECSLLVLLARRGPLSIFLGGCHCGFWFWRVGSTPHTAQGTTLHTMLVVIDDSSCLLALHEKCRCKRIAGLDKRERTRLIM